MKYFKIKNSRDRKIVGFPYQTNGYIDGYNENAPCSRTNLTYDKYPDFVPDLRFELQKKSKLTDIVDASNISATGFLMNEKAKGVFDMFNIPTHKFYEASILDHNHNVLPYYWMHIISNDYELVDFENSVFRKSSFPLKDSETKKCEQIEVRGIKDLRTKNEILFEEGHYVVADILKVKNKPKYDLLHFMDISEYIYVSESLANKIKEIKISGVEIIEDVDFLVF